MENSSCARRRENISTPRRRASITFVLEQFNWAGTKAGRWAGEFSSFTGLGWHPVLLGCTGVTSRIQTVSLVTDALDKWFALLDNGEYDASFWPPMYVRTDTGLP